MTPEESNIVNHATIKYFVGNAWWSVLVAFLKQNQKTSFLMFSKPMMSDQLLEALSMHYNFYQFSCRIDSNIWKYHVVPYCDLPNLRDLLRKIRQRETYNVPENCRLSNTHGCLECNDGYVFDELGNCILKF